MRSILGRWGVTVYCARLIALLHQSTQADAGWTPQLAFELLSAGGLKMNSTSALTKQAESCLVKRAEIPGAPLWHMGMAAKFGSVTSFSKVQEAIYYLTCKAKVRLPFDSQERDFLKELYEAFWWGGHYNGYREAAALANHYVNGDGKALKINEEVYKSSIIVRDASAAMKEFIQLAWQATRKIPPMLYSGDPAFRNSQQLRTLTSASGRSQRTQGILRPEGTLQAEQDNARLQKADNRFYLKVYSAVLRERTVVARWRVDSIYDFEPFEKADHFTRIPLAKDVALVLPDGLSQYMTNLGVAKVFDYYAEWHETWSL
jgi:hypothetical protein